MEQYKLICNTKDFDQKKGEVAFYFANFKTPDRNGRLMHRNAFNRTIKGNFQNMVHLLNHDPNAIIGKPIRIETDENGAFMVSKLSKNDLGRNALTMYEEGIYNQHSFGFEILNSTVEKDFELVKEVRMWEASTVTWGAHPDTPVISLNQANNEELINRIKSLDEKLALLIQNQALLLGQDHQDSLQDGSVADLIAFIDNF